MTWKENRRPHRLACGRTRPQHSANPGVDARCRDHARPNGREQTVGRHRGGRSERQNRRASPWRGRDRALHRQRWPRPHARGGEKLEFVEEAGPGDFIYVPPFVPAPGDQRQARRTGGSGGGAQRSGNRWLSTSIFRVRKRFRMFRGLTRCTGLTRSLNALHPFQNGRRHGVVRCVGREHFRDVTVILEHHDGGTMTRFTELLLQGPRSLKLGHALADRAQPT